MKKYPQIIFVILPDYHILDLAGPLQVFAEASNHDIHFPIRYVALNKKTRCAEGLYISPLEPISSVKTNPGDYIFIPGFSYTFLKNEKYLHLKQSLIDWLKLEHLRKVKLCSVCTGAFVLGQAGFLDGRRCTTHWARTELLSEIFPKCKIEEDTLFVKDNGVYTSAGMLSGIDLSLSILEDEIGPVLTAKVARDMVLYLRRDGTQSQHSIYLDYRNHLSPGVHAVQDWLVANPGAKLSIPQLADIASMSVRNLTRSFKKHTGLTISDYHQQLRLELAKKLLLNPNLTVEAVASECGFQGPGQFRRFWNKYVPVSASAFRKTALENA